MCNEGKTIYSCPKEKSNGVFYMVDAPSKRIAKWCGANLFNNEYIDFLSAKDVIAERFKVKGGVEERGKLYLEESANITASG